MNLLLYTKKQEYYAQLFRVMECLALSLRYADLPRNKKAAICDADTSQMA